MSEANSDKTRPRPRASGTLFPEAIFDNLSRFAGVSEVGARRRNPERQRRICCSGRCVSRARENQPQCCAKKTAAKPEARAPRERCIQMVGGYVADCTHQLSGQELTGRCRLRSPVPERKRNVSFNPGRRSAEFSITCSEVRNLANLRKMVNFGASAWVKPQRECRAAVRV